MICRLRDVTVVTMNDHVQVAYFACSGAPLLLRTDTLHLNE